MKSVKSRFVLPTMALFPPSNGKQKPSWKLLPALLLVVLVLAFLLFRDSRSIVESSHTTHNAEQIVIPSSIHLRLPSEVTGALVHYAASDTTPQQTHQEISLTAKVLQDRGPCNLLVFGLGHDSLLWKTLNHGGRTVFLEESEDWIRQISEKFPDLESHLVEYTTVLTDSDSLLEHARENVKGKCTPVQNLLLSECRLALYNLPDEIVRTEWDVIMVDAPRGYFEQAPGRMSAIFSAAVMARSRKASHGAEVNGTDVFVHDVERPVEKRYSEEFLCVENLVEESESGHLWHFRVFPAPPEKHEFCKRKVTPATTASSSQAPV